MDFKYTEEKELIKINNVMIHKYTILYYIIYIELYFEYIFW